MRGRWPTGPSWTRRWRVTDGLDRAQQALAIARDIGDPALLARALNACGSTAAADADVAGPYLAEAAGLARAVGDKWQLAEILAGRHMRRSPRVTRSRCARPARRHAIWPTRSGPVPLTMLSLGPRLRASLPG